MPGAGPLFLGVDGGGTKTDVLLAGADGAPVRRLRLGDGTLVDLECAACASLDEPPRVTVRSSRPIPVFVNDSPIA